MSIYKKIVEIGSKYIGKDKLFKYGFNLSPMYRRSTARIIRVSKDLLYVPGGFMQVRGFPELVQSSKMSHDLTNAKRLWELSEQLTGVQY